MVLGRVSLDGQARRVFAVVNSCHQQLGDPVDLSDCDFCHRSNSRLVQASGILNPLRTHAVNTADLGSMLRQARRTLPQLAKLTGSVKTRALQAMARRIQEQQDALLEANTLDLEQLRGQATPEWVLQGMKLTPERLQRAARQLQVLSTLPDPIGQIDRSWRQENGLLLNRHRVPLGLIAILYEIHPESAIGGIGMGLKAGNGVVLCSSPALAGTHQVLFDLLSAAAYSCGVPEGALLSAQHNHSLAEDMGEFSLPLLQQSRYLDVVIPCGRPHWVESIRQASTTAVLHTCLGHGHIYVDATATWTQVQTVILQQLTPDGLEGIPLGQAVLQWLLLHRSWIDQHGQNLLRELTHRGISVQISPELQPTFPSWPITADQIDSIEQVHVRLQAVNDLSEAIAWINKNGQRHCETILTDSEACRQRFVQEVDTALVYVNSSPFTPDRWAGTPVFDHQGGIALGTSIQRLHPRGPIDLHTLTTVKYVAIG
jgi:glutamate-5-semialdehyde dehydrogenase